jgi:hypothetical protein
MHDALARRREEARMHGLKCAGAFPGWTRLCDEWLIGLDRPWGEGGTTPWESPALAVRTVADAAFRTRRFARGADEPLDPIEPDAAGVLRFELQGVDYVVATDACTPSDAPEALLAAAGAKLEALLPKAKGACAGADDHPVALLVLAPHLEASGDEARRAFVDRTIAAFRDAEITHALAYAFPRTPGSFEGHYATSARPGAFLLARSGVYR